MSPLQMLRAALHSLSDKHTMAKGVFMEVDTASGLPKCTSPFKHHCDVVLVDSSGWLNVIFNVSKSAFAQVRAAPGRPLGNLPVRGGCMNFSPMLLCDILQAAISRCQATLPVDGEIAVRTQAIAFLPCN